MKRRILEKLKLTEISGVDKPCQRGAVVTIMKRDPEASVEALNERVAKLKQQIATLNKAFDTNQPRGEDGKWSRVGQAIARAGRAVGRATAQIATGAALGAATGAAVTAWYKPPAKIGYYERRAAVEAKWAARRKPKLLVS